MESSGLPRRSATDVLLAKPAYVGPEVCSDAGLPPYTSLSRATGPARRQVCRGRGPGPSGRGVRCGGIAHLRRCHPFVHRRVGVAVGYPVGGGERLAHVRRLTVGGPERDRETELKLGVVKLLVHLVPFVSGRARCTRRRDKSLSDNSVPMERSPVLRSSLRIR